MAGWKGEVEVDGQWHQNGVVWPDEESAAKAARDLYIRWTPTSGHRAVQTDEAVNRPTWDEHVGKVGMPPMSVQL